MYINIKVLRFLNKTTLLYNKLSYVRRFFNYLILLQGSSLRIVSLLIIQIVQTKFNNLQVIKFCEFWGFSHHYNWGFQFSGLGAASLGVKHSTNDEYLHLKGNKSCVYKFTLDLCNISVYTTVLRVYIKHKPVSVDIVMARFDLQMFFFKSHICPTCLSECVVRSQLHT